MKIPSSGYSRYSQNAANRNAALPQPKQSLQAPPAPSNAQLAQLVNDLQTRVAALEQRLYTLESAIDVSGGNVAIHADGEIVLSGRQVSIDAEQGMDLVSGLGGSIEVSSSGVEITATSTLELNAGATVDINASTIDANVAVADFSGIAKCSTLQADTVIAATYTPGAGNIW